MNSSRKKKFQIGFNYLEKLIKPVNIFHRIVKKKFYKVKFPPLKQSQNSHISLTKNQQIHLNNTHKEIYSIPSIYNSKLSHLIFLFIGFNEKGRRFYSPNGASPRKTELILARPVLDKQRKKIISAILSISTKEFTAKNEIESITGKDERRKSH